MKSKLNREKLTPPNFWVGIRNISDYSPFGVLLKERTVESAFFRRGYQSSERYDELKGSGNSYTTQFRQLDPRTARWLSMDPEIQPWQSPFCSMDNNPILYNDVLGLYTKRKAEKVAEQARKSGANAMVVERAIGKKTEYCVHVTLESNKPGAYFEKTFYKIKYDKDKLVYTDYSNEGPGGPELTFGFFRETENKWKSIEDDWAKSRKKWDTFEEGMQDYFELMATILSGAEAAEGLYVLGRWGVTKLTTRTAAKKGVQYSDDLVKAAQELYPKKAGKIELHHITPKYLGGAKNGSLAPLDASYHQVITNEFRTLWPYGKGIPSATELENIMHSVYSKYPLPPGF